MTSKTKIIATGAIGFLVFIGILVFAFQPLLSSVKVLNTDLSTKQSELDEINKQIVEFKSAQSDLAKATYKNDISDTIVVKEDLASAIKQLEEAADNTNTEEGIQIIDADPKVSGKAAQPDIFSSLAKSQEVHYAMSVKNSFPGLVEYFQYLEHLPHFTEFDRITLNSVYEQLSLQQGGGTRNTGTVQGNVEGVFLVKSANDDASSAGINPDASATPEVGQ